jgi:AraC family transcriptional regulator
MVLQKLPYAHLYADRHKPPVYTDHYLFTGTISKQYEYPEHTSGLGILTTLNGNGHYFINGRKTTIDAHSFALVNNGSKLAVQMHKPETQPVFLFFNTRLAAHADLGYMEGMHVKTKALHEALCLLPGLGDSCSSFHSLKADGIIRSILEKLVIQNARAVKLAAGLRVMKTSTRIELFQRLSLCKEWIDANFANPISLNEMAQVAALNSQHFLRMFSQCYGLTPHQYLMNIRLDYCKKMLRETTEPITSVCTNAGFESITSFSWLFKKRFGVSPSQFRK